MKYKSQIVTQASGSVGGTTYSHNRGGLYQRARSIPTNPASSFQVAVRDFVADVTNRWLTTLTQAQRDGWDVYATQVLLPDSLGEPRNVGGIGMYLRSNVPRLQGSLTRIDAPPVVYNLGVFTTPVLTATAPTTLSVAFTAADPWHAAGGGGLVLASRGQNGSINFFAGPYRFAGIIASGDASPKVLTAPFPLTAGQKVFCQFRATQPDGRLSAAVRFLDVVA